MASSTFTTPLTAPPSSFSSLSPSTRSSPCLSLKSTGIPSRRPRIVSNSAFLINPRIFVSNSTSRSSRRVFALVLRRSSVSFPLLTIAAEKEIEKEKLRFTCSLFCMLHKLLQCMPMCKLFCQLYPPDSQP